jgi:hypothetical protein
MNNQEDVLSPIGRSSRREQDESRRGESSVTTGKIQQVAEQARKVTSEKVDAARESAESMKSRTADRVRKFSQVVRKIGEQLRVDDQQYFADQANYATERLEDVATYIDQTEIGTLLNDAEDVFRKRPAAVLGGALLLGLAAGRILKTPGRMS